MGNASRVLSLVLSGNRKSNTKYPRLPRILYWIKSLHRFSGSQKLGMNDVEPRRPVAPCCALPVAGAALSMKPADASYPIRC